MGDVKFDTMRNGYNRYQVDDKVAQLTSEVETLQKKLDLYVSRLDEVEKQSASYKEKYLTLAGEIRIKEKAAEDIARIALKEANVIVQTANDNADVIVKEALASARAILIEVNKLGEETGEIKQRMIKELDKLDQALSEFEVPRKIDLNLLEE
ncbi:DivIVA domain-containing protein [uncultured Traorella sp.]|jgi:cell division initiation protein|uniref:DivIVA domain-containing protein n=1 Tax=uncultured Traorella sp. TaxID=1929048 RepID=UPI0025E5B869|nr:DivIVA domain-containing protein [uncultured Traorella sp.]